MIPSLFTYNGGTINDGVNYRAVILAENEEQGGADITYVPRPYSRPVYSGKTLQEYQMVIGIEMLGAPATQIDTLKGLFDVEDFTAHALVIKDTNNSSKQYYVNATTQRFFRTGPKRVVVTLAIADPVWLAVSETAASAWSVTASAQTKAVTVGGNVAARPRIEIIPTAVRGTGYAYKRNVIIRNRTSKKLVKYPLEITSAGWNTEDLLYYETNHAHVNNVAGIAADATTIPYTSEAGTLPSRGLAMIENEQIRYTGKSGGNLTGVTRGMNGTTAATHANTVQINQSLIQADGDDIRVHMDGKEIPRWVYGAGTAATKVWIAQDFGKKIELPLYVAIADAGALTAIEFEDNKAMRTIFKDLPSRGLVLIGTELLRYTAKNTGDMTLTGITRGANGTTAAAHAADVTVYYIEHEIVIYYSNMNAPAPDADSPDRSDGTQIYNANKPVFELSSTNTSWVYATFKDSTGQRAGSWKPNVVYTANNGLDSTNKSRHYTGSRGVNVATATEMGAMIQSYKYGGTWKAGNATIVWELQNPCGLTTITASGEKYRYTTSWPSAAYCQYSTDGASWSNAWTTEATPGTAQAWESLETHSAVSLGGTANYVRMTFSGSLSATANNVAYLSYTDLTLVPDTNYVPAITLGDQISNYHLNVRLKNTTSGESFVVDTGMLLNGTLEIDCLNKEVTLTAADSEKDVRKEGALVSFSSVRTGWLDLAPGDNTLAIYDIDTTGTLTLTVNIFWQDRNN